MEAHIFIPQKPSAPMLAKAAKLANILEKHGYKVKIRFTEKADRVVAILDGAIPPDLEDEIRRIAH